MAFAEEPPEGHPAMDEIPHEGVTRANPPISANAPPIHPMDWRKLEHATPPERDWAIDHWLGMNHVTLLAGAGGVGKSLVSQMIGSALCLGENYLGTIVQPRRVLIWACEDDADEIWRRQVAIARYFDVPLSAFADGNRLVIVPRSGEENTLRTKQGWCPLWAELQEQVCDYKADVLFLDNVGQTCSEEIDRYTVTSFVNGCAGLGKPADLKTATVLLAHPGKSLGSEYSGSTAWENACRMRWYFGAKLPDQEKDESDPPADGERFLSKRKTNYSVRDFRRFTYDNGVLIPDQESGLPPAHDMKMRTLHAEGVIMRAIPVLTAMGKFPTDGSTSPEYLPKLILEFKLGEGMQKKELGIVMRGLMVLGRIRRAQIGAYSNRNPRIGLVLSE